MKMRQDHHRKDVMPSDVIIEAYGDPIMNDEAIRSLTIEAMPRGSNLMDSNQDDDIDALALESCGSKGPERSLSNLMNKTTQLQQQKDHPYKVIKQNQVNFSRKQQFQN